MFRPILSALLPTLILLGCSGVARRLNPDATHASGHA